ncbi:MAG: hypothetical protein WBA17_10735 [Saprospiraceae bacterium]
MNDSSHRLRFLTATLLLAGGVFFLGFLVDRTQFGQLLAAFTAAFAGYALFIGTAAAAGPDTPAPFLSWHRTPTGRLLLFGLGLRILLLFAFPRLSDDIYRFVWDGRLIIQGINPFSHLPGHYLTQSVPGLTPELFARLNSPDYYTIYPPIAQGVFAAAAWLFPTSVAGSALVLQVFLLACEVGSLFLLLAILRRYGLPPARALLYWLNPLVIIEITGNLHFEGAMVCFTLLGIYLLLKQRWAGAGAALAAAVAAKLLPLLLLPFLLRRLWWRPLLWFSIAFGGVTLLLFLPLLTTSFPANFGSSLDLYFRKFEFNASLYYLARAYGYYQIGWNQIARFGPLLAQAAAGAILLFALLEPRPARWRQLPVRWLAAFVIYLLCATTVHPWYLSLPVVLCVFTPWRFPLVWSFLIALTYTTYTTDPYRENLWLVALEYLTVLAFALGEWWWRRRTPGRLEKAV